MRTLGLVAKEPQALHDLRLLAVRWALASASGHCTIWTSRPWAVSAQMIAMSMAITMIAHTG